MHRYFIKTPWLVKKLFNSYTWNLKENEKSVYLTFDDGPHPEITPWVLEELNKFQALATFFCIGKNVEAYENIYTSIIHNKHSTGNHTYNHLNGWKTNDEVYLQDVVKASQLIHSNLFRPPYGKIKATQARSLFKTFGNTMNIIMWDVLSADFDNSYSSRQCVKHVIDNTSNGSIIVFHDSEKAFSNLKQALPEVLGFLISEGYQLKKIEQTGL